MKATPEEKLKRATRQWKYCEQSLAKWHTKSKLAQTKIKVWKRRVAAASRKMATLRLTGAE